MRYTNNRDALIKSITVHDENNVKGFFGPYRFLSNFEVAEIEFEGLIYPSTENAYQAAKTLDNDERIRFTMIKPNESKQLGRNITIRPDWEDVKFKVMYDVCKYKFTNHSTLKQLLIDTGDKYLEETNYWNDRIWGVCDGRGDNNLGKTLMQIRDEIKLNI